MAGAVDEKATRRNNGNVARVALPKSRPADDATIARASGARSAARDVSGAWFPATAAAVRAADQDMINASARGETGRAAGASLRRAVTVPVGMAYDAASLAGHGVVNALDPIRRGVMGVLGGFAGSDGTTTVNKAYTPPAAVAPAANPVAAAMVAGRDAPQAITAHDQMLAQLSTILGSGNATMSDLKSVSGMLPAPAKAVSPKDTVTGDIAKHSKDIYDAEIASIVAARKAGEIDQKTGQQMVQKAARDQFLRGTALVGNPLSFAQANMLPAPTDEEEED